MSVNSSSTLETDPRPETGQVMGLDDQTSNGGRTPGGILPQPDAVRQLRWSPDVVRRLYEDAEWALTSNPTGAAEIAGLLLGKSHSTVEIIDCHPVFLMHERDH